MSGRIVPWKFQILVGWGQVVTPRIRHHLDALRWTYGTLAREMRVSPSTVRRWDTHEAYPPPDGVRAWLEGASDWMRANPPPGTREASGSV